MAQLFGGLISLAVFFGIFYVFAQAVLAPINARLDRVIALLEVPRNALEVKHSRLTAGDN